jgi:queuine tRNA-ribosyltransferase
MSPFQLIQFEQGVTTIQDSRSSESMHSSIGPWEEACQIYVKQAQFELRLSQSPSKPLVIYDIGLGIGANALATIDTLFQLPIDPCQKQRKVEIISFETDPSGIAFALEHLNAFPFMRKYEHILRELLKTGTTYFFSDSGIEFNWSLHVGDFRKWLGLTPPAELIYFDLYSPKVSPELWSLDSFELCFQAAVTHSDPSRETKLITYCSATSVRSALLLAGFHVGIGVSTPAKRDTTLASTNLSSLNQPLDSRWIEHLKRSAKPFPLDCLNIDHKILYSRIEKMLYSAKLR